jgi:hypothetical protein
VKRVLVVLVALLAVGCGSDHLALTTPGTRAAAVSPEEREILANWGEQLRRADPRSASRDFGIPAYVSHGAADEWVELADRAAVERFNHGFTCGATLLSADRRSDGFVVGTFELVEQPGVNRCGDRTGQLRMIAVKIEGHRISRWVPAGSATVA